MHESADDQPIVADRALLNTAFDEDRIDYWAHLRTIWDGRWWVVGITLAAALLSAAYFVTRPPVYSAAARVYLMRAAFSTNLRPGRLPPDAYSSLAESSGILESTDVEIARRHPEPIAGLKFTARVTGTAQALDDPYASVLELTATARSADEAKLAADTWARVFVAEMAKLTPQSKSASVDFVLSEYPRIAQNVDETSRALATLKARQSQELNTLTAQLNVDLERARLRSLQESVILFERHALEAKREQAQFEAKVEALEKELGAITQRLTTARRAAGGGSVEETEQLNPAYADLTVNLATERANLKSAEAEVKGTLADLAAVRADAQRVQRAVMAADIKIGEVGRRQSAEVTDYDRAAKNAQLALDMMTRQIGEARIAKSMEDPEVRFASEAIKPRLPKPSPWLLRTALVALVSFFAAIVGVWSVTQVRRSYAADAVRHRLAAVSDSRSR